MLRVMREELIVELKAAQEIDVAHEKQLLNYLKATTFELMMQVIGSLAQEVASQANLRGRPRC